MPKSSLAIREPLFSGRIEKRIAFAACDGPYRGKHETGNKDDTKREAKGTVVTHGFSSDNHLLPCTSMNRGGLSL